MAAVTNNLEDYLPGVLYNGVNTNKNVAIGGSANFDASGSTGTFKLPTGAVTFGGGAIAGGASVLQGVNQNVILSALVGATVVLTVAQSGSVCINRSTSGTPSWTLPVGVAGNTFTFITANTTAGYTVTNATQVIHFKTTATGTVLTSTTTLTNTQGTAIVGDFISMVCDGTAWWMTAISGTFAAS